MTAGELVVGEVGDHALVSRLLAEHRVDTVMHFAAHTIVPESVALPLKYYGNNTCSTAQLAAGLYREPGVDISSFPRPRPCTACRTSGYAGEESPTRPINAYGTSKLMSEWMLRDVAAVNPLRYVALRYFNVAGSDPSRPHRPGDPGATLLTKVACEAMVGKRTHVSVFGTRLPDARWHRACATICTSRIWPRRICGRSIICAPPGRSVTLNVGYGHGYSVREVLGDGRGGWRQAPGRFARRRAGRAIRPTSWRAPQRIQHRARLAAAL